MAIDLPPDCSGLVARLSEHPEPGSFARAFDRQMECQRLAEAGWSTANVVAAERREVRRVSFRDGRLTFRIPAVALERRRDGTVHVNMSASGLAGRRTAEVPQDLWAQTAAFHALVQGKVERRTWQQGDPLPLMHCTTAVLEEAQSRKVKRREVSECELADKDALRMAYRIAAIAVTYIPECRVAQGETESANPPPAEDWPVWTLLKCGGRVEPQMLPLN
jgi:hypothetical protein